MPEFVSRPKPVAPQQRKEDPNTFHCPGSYEAALLAVCTEAVADPYWALSDEADIPGRTEEHEAEEAALIAQEISRRRGQPVTVRQYQLPVGVSSRFPNLPTNRQNGFRVSPDDYVTLVPRPHNGAVIR